MFLHMAGLSTASPDHQDIIKKLVDLIGITSIMEVLIRFIGADEHIYANCGDTMQWLEEMDILDMIVDKFSSSDCPEVHANAAETLCTITRWAPPGLTSKISSPSFIGRLFRHALEESRPKTVLVNLLLVCTSLLDPKRLTSGIYYMYNRQTSHGPGATANPETVKSMLERLGDLLKLLDVPPEEHALPTTYGKLQPPLEKHRLKIIEFISVLVAVSSDVAEKELIRLGAVERILELFFQIIILLTTFFTSVIFPTVSADVKLPPRIGNIRHLTRIANKLIQLGNSDSEVQKLLQENSEWIDWQTNVLLKRNTLENVFQWTCGRPTTLQDRTRDSDDDDYQDRDYDVAALVNNLSQAFRYGIYSNDANNEGDSSLERDDEESGGGSLFTNSNWFAFEDERIDNEHSIDPNTSTSPEHMDIDGRADEDTVEKDEEDFTMSKPVSEPDVPEIIGSDKTPEWVEWRESEPTSQSLSLPNGEILESKS
ncbi:hypothetical protein OROHE_009518 [Orobanche hederae]